MQISKKGVFLLSVAFTQFGIILYLLPANCNSTSTRESPTLEQDKQPKRVAPKWHKDNFAEQECYGDNDCPNDSVCQNGSCYITEPADYYAIDAGDTIGPRNCETAEDCGCGYECKYNECHKLDSACCANADCEDDLICIKEYSELSGRCAVLECDSVADCDNQCNMYCSNHQCLKSSTCCTDADCEYGTFCAVPEGRSKGYCLEAKCFSDTDCDCGYACEPTTHQCVGYSPNRPIPCCGTDVYYNGSCYSHEAIEDGNCLEDKNCPPGNICYEGEYEDRCIPAKCTNNADCGCGASCWNGSCELGCNDNNACCDPDFPVCKHGECINPNPENNYE